MRDEKELSNFNLKYLFLLLYLIHPTVYFLFLIFALGIDKLIPIFKIILILAPPIILLFTFIFIVLNRRLSKIAATESFDEEESIKFINKFSLHGMNLLISGCTGGPLLTVIIGLFSLR